MRLPAALPGSRAGQLHGKHPERSLPPEESKKMASIKRPDPRIGVDDPRKEPEPPELDKAGDLGPVGERKQEKADMKYKDGIWRDGPVAEGVPAGEGDEKR
jgi:hypothetical protein